MRGRWMVLGTLLGLLVASHAGAARIGITASRTDLLYSASPGTPSCSDLSKTADAALPFHIVRLTAELPPGVPVDSVRFQWSFPSPPVGMLAADVDLGPDEQDPALRALCAELGNGCVLTEEQLALYNKKSILWIAPGCDVLPDDTTRPYRGGVVKMRVRVTTGRRRLGKGKVSFGFGRLGSLELLVQDPGDARFRNGIGVPGGEKIHINPVFAARLDTAGLGLPELERLTIDSNGGGAPPVSMPCGSFTGCTTPGDVLYTAGGKHVASTIAALTDGSALCDKLTVNVLTTVIVPELQVSVAPKRDIYIPGDPARGSVALRVRLHNASPPGSGGNILLLGNVLTCNTEVRVGKSTLTKATQIDLQHCSATVTQPCQSDAECRGEPCPECQPSEICLTASHCSTPTVTPIGCTSDADCRPPRCTFCSPIDTCIQVLPLARIFLGVGDSVDLIESTIPVANTLSAPARVTDTWTVHTFNAGDDSDVVKYGIAPRPSVKP